LALVSCEYPIALVAQIRLGLPKSRSAAFGPLMYEKQNQQQKQNKI
jgi:hypothetical protein